MTHFVKAVSASIAIHLALVFLPAFLQQTEADMVTVINSGFEDTTGQQVFNEFTFGVPVGWSAYDPSNILGEGVFLGTLMPNGVDFFNGPAPEGSRVGILFNSQREGDGEYGYEQTLAATLQPNTHYSLTIEVGNIGSGFATNGTFFNLDEFPGYRVELLAGGTVIAQDNNSLSIPEAEFATSTVEFTTTITHAQLGQNLGIRLVNLNIVPAGYTQATSPDLEVDFDQLVLQANAIPEPQQLGFLGLLVLLARVRRKSV